MLQVLQERLADVSYDYFRCQTLAKELAAEIQSRARDFRWARYKILCQVPLVDCVSRFFFLIISSFLALEQGNMDKGNMLVLIFPPCHSFLPLSNLSFLLSRFLLSHSSFVLSHSFSFFLMHRSVGQFKTDLFFVQVTLGQKTQQSVQVASRCLWDQAVDNYASVTYATQSVFAVAQCYGVYYE